MTALTSTTAPVLMSQVVHLLSLPSIAPPIALLRFFFLLSHPSNLFKFAFPCFIPACISPASYPWHYPYPYQYPTLIFPDYPYPRTADTLPHGTTNPHFYHLPCQLLKYPHPHIHPTLPVDSWGTQDESFPLPHPVALFPPDSFRPPPHPWEG
eukprot:761559-Hanusia_phi.AAC.3